MASRKLRTRYHVIEPNPSRSLPLGFDSRTYRWQRLITRPDRVIDRKRDLIVVTGAITTERQNPSEIDRMNAGLAALVVSRQVHWRRHTNVRAFLKFEDSVHTEIQIHLEELERRVIQARFAQTMPTQLAAYLLTRQADKGLRKSLS